MASPLAKSTPRPSPRFWGCWGLAAISSGRWGRVISRRVRGDFTTSCQLAVVRVADQGSVSGSPWWTRRSQTWQPLARQKWLLDQLFLTTLILITLAGGKNLQYCLDYIKINGCIVQEGHNHVVVFTFEHFQILHDEEGPCHPPCYVWALQRLSNLWIRTSDQQSRKLT